MSDRYWTEETGDTIVVHTDYVRGVARFTDSNIPIQRGGGHITARESADAYCRALESKGYVRKPR
jgi:hypothetical protein